MTSSVSVAVLALFLAAQGQRAPGQPAPGKPAPAKPAPVKPASVKPVAAPVQTAPSPNQVCEYITPDEAKGLLGAEATPSSAPTKGLFTSCGYTSPSGDAVTVYVSDYGLPSVAQQFFDKTREVLKTAANDDTIGVPAFLHITPPGPVAMPAAPGAAPAASPGGQVTPGALGIVMLLALKDHRTVKLEASGPLVTQPQHLPKLRAIITRVVSTLPAPAPPAPETPR